MVEGTTTTPIPLLTKASQETIWGTATAPIPLLTKASRETIWGTMTTPIPLLTKASRETIWGTTTTPVPLLTKASWETICQGLLIQTGQKKKILIIYLGGPSQLPFYQILNAHPHTRGCITKESLMPGDMFIGIVMMDTCW